MSLLALACLLPAGEFALCGFAFAVAEVARCLVDSGVDPVLLRRSEELPAELRRRFAADALSIKLSNSVPVLAVVLVLMSTTTDLSLVALLISLQFLPQALLQTSLNIAQVDNVVHRVGWPLVAVYGAGLVLALLSFAGFSVGEAGLPLIAAGELGVGAWLGRTHLRLVTFRVWEPYRKYFPLALNMAGVSLLALINTRVDSLLVNRLLPAEQAGQYMYLIRWSDLMPMLAGGIAMPLVGKLRGHSAALSGLGSCFVPLAVLVCAFAAPPALVWLAMWSSGQYSVAGSLPWIIAACGTVRVGLVVVSTLMLSHWLDRTLLLVAIGSATLMSLAVWVLGLQHGAQGVAVAVLSVEVCNLAVQLLLLGRATRRAVASGGQC